MACPVSTDIYARGSVNGEGRADKAVRSASQNEVHAKAYCMTSVE